MTRSWQGGREREFRKMPICLGGRRRGNRAVPHGRLERPSSGGPRQGPSAARSRSGPGVVGHEEGCITAAWQAATPHCGLAGGHARLSCPPPSTLGIQQRSTATTATAANRQQPLADGRPAVETSATVSPVVRIEGCRRRVNPGSGSLSVPGRRSVTGTAIMSGRHVGRRIRLRITSKSARPNICRLSILLLWPSTAPEL
jgi:hypothetical protein